MIDEGNAALDTRAAALRQAFDQTFAAPPTRGTEAERLAFLAIGVGGDHYALRLAEVAELFADKRVVPLPSQSPDLLGIASFRGALVAVYDLRLLLGYPAAAPPRWLVLAAQDAAVGLAFDQLDGYIDAALDALAPMVGTERARPHLAETLRDADLIRPVIRAASILDMIGRRAQAARVNER
jgi:chemotaxis signal transduction protein